MHVKLAQALRAGGRGSSGRRAVLAPAAEQVGACRSLAKRHCPLLPMCRLAATMYSVQIPQHILLANQGQQLGWQLSTVLPGVQVAVLRSAVQMEQEQHFLIAKKLQELTGAKNIKLKPVIDESLIAGFVVEYGSSQIDMSLAGQLNQITNDLEGSEAAMA